MQVKGLNHNLSIIRSIFDSNEEDKTFKYSVPSQASGGAACINGSTVTILSSNFSRNIAYGEGGVFHIEYSTLYMWKSIFYGNKANFANGGVISSISSSVNILINESAFNFNNASGDGGVIYVGMNGSQVRIVDSSFDHNCAGSGNGHIVAIHGSQLDIKDMFILNTNVSGCLCGIISSYMSNITINVQENFTKVANPEYMYTLYDIEGTKSCDHDNIYDKIGGDDEFIDSELDLLPLWSLIQSETSSQIALTVSLILLTTISLLVLGFAITSIILYRRGKLRFKKWPGLRVKNPSLYVPMKESNTSE